MSELFCKSSKSSEKFEANKVFLQISEQFITKKDKYSYDEVVRDILSRLSFSDFLSGSLPVVDFSVDEINQIIDSGNELGLINVCEGLQEAGISSIAEHIAAHSGVRVVLVAGPSSSGKTTFSKKLTYALQQQGMRPHPLSLDDYFVNREDTPLDIDGKKDYESLYAVNLEMFQQQLNDLLAGKEVATPRYDFMLGECIQGGGPTIKLGGNDILIIEGIHGLNPKLTEGIPSENIFRIYISALTAYKINESDEKPEFFPTTDNRKIRRMVRDSQFRGTTAQGTIDRWPSVRRGEEKWIVPFQSNADINFNSAFQYELCLLRKPALDILNNVRPDEPEYEEAARLISLLNQYREISPDSLPPYSLLREFLGGSAYVY